MEQPSPDPTRASGRIELTGIGAALAAAAGLGLLSAVGDWIWFHWLEDGALAPAIGHGLLFFVALAVALGASAPRPGRTTGRLLAVLPAVGVGLAAVFSPLAGVVGYLGGLLVTWTAMWIALAFGLAWAAERRESARASALRALAAAVASGAAFSTASWMWTAPDPDGPSVVLHFVCWTWALVPGMLALLVRRADP